MIYIGTSGFSYDDWKGFFYPEKLNTKDMLKYYAHQFPAVEINSSYYAIPGARSFASMVDKTPDGFKFAVKAHKDMTHAENPDPNAFDMFLGAITPLQEAGKFGCMLAQYPWGFKKTPENKDELRRFRERVGDLPTVIEFRNAEWVEPETFQLLTELNFGFCSVDEPHLKGLMPDVTAVTSSIGYVRFHGRNAQKWWKHDQAYERYDYLYSEEELQEWVPKVENVSLQASDTYLFFNNHFQGKAANNARMLARMLGLPLPTEELAGEPQLSFGDDF